MPRKGHLFTLALVLFAAIAMLAYATGGSGGSRPEIGFLAVGAQTYQAAFWQGLERNGLIDGRNLVVRRAIGSGDPSELESLASDLVRRNVAVIVATSSAAVRAALERTTEIPIVSVTSADPLGSGFIQSYAKPGGNVTGLAGVEPIVATKNLQLLQLVVPEARRVAVFWNSTHPIHPIYLDGLRKYARLSGITISEIKVEKPSDIQPAFAAVDAQSVQALVVLIDQAINRNREQIVREANARRLPAIYPLGEFTQVGGLMSYGVNYSDLHDRAADYVARLLGGARAANLPVERPLNFELVINLDTADRLGLQLPTELVLRARTIRDATP